MGSKEYELYKEELEIEKEERLDNIEKNRERWEGLTFWQRIVTIALMSSSLSLLLLIVPFILSLFPLIYAVVSMIRNGMSAREIVLTTLLMLLTLVGIYLMMFVAVFIAQCIGLLIELVLDHFGIAHRAILSPSVGIGKGNRKKTSNIHNKTR